MLLLVGLGNPGKEYENTRHNAGFVAIDAIASAISAGAFKSKFSGQFSTGDMGGEKIFLLKPETYMNLSGGSVKKAAAFYKIPTDNIAENIIVFHDDIDLELGRVRVKTGGGHGGHNGLRDIDLHMGKNYKRVRIGVGRPAAEHDVKNYVLKSFSASEQILFNELIQSIRDNISCITLNDDCKFMTRVAEHMRPLLSKEKIEKEEK